MIRAAALLLLALSAPLAVPAAADPPAAADAEFELQVDRLVRRGDDDPDGALRALQALEPRATDARRQRALMLARGSVHARNGRDADATGWAHALRTHAGQSGDEQAEAAAKLVQAMVAHHAARLEEASGLASDAYATLRRACPFPADAELPVEPGSAVSALPAAVSASPSGCDAPATWQALLLLQSHAARGRLWVAAAGHARNARALAAWAGDDPRLAQSAADLAVYTARADGLDSAQPLLRQAQRIAARVGDPGLIARVKLAEARIAAQHDDRESEARLAEEALPLARSADSARLEAEVLVFLSDAYAKLGRPADALRAAERGLPIVRRLGDRYAEITLTNNAGLARIGLHRFTEGRADLARVEAMTQAVGLQAVRAEALREFDEALAAAGDAAGALELFHRERTLAAEITRRNRDATQRALQLRNDHDRQQREIALLARENRLKAAELENRELLQRLGAVAAALLALAAGAMALLYRRVRRVQHQLESNQAQLRVQSERDPLTHLSNRRHFHAVMQTARLLGPAGRGFEGALLLVDIDHFKHVNDGHGHAAGDQVLCEVARRLGAAVRADDLVVRWGGEEFLVLAPQVTEADTEALAERVLRGVGEEPMRVDGRPVAVTVSVGYASFPLPPGQLPVGWEQAINLADMALYMAKNQGRNRAGGIVAAQASDPHALRGIEADFDRAWHDGRVTLKVAPGPLVAA
jgi:diguanylate cyclase (GGDEF)-like protein